MMDDHWSIINMCLLLIGLYNLAVYCIRGEEGQPHQFLVRATFSSFSLPRHLGILVLRLLRVLEFPILEDKSFFIWQR